MPKFKYTVANKQGKKLSGAVEAPDEQTARNELNNLGFSILGLEKSAEVEAPAGKGRFVFEGIDKNSKFITGTIPTETPEEAVTKLSGEYGLTVTAIWKEGASENEIQEARQKGTSELQESIQKIAPKKARSAEENLNEAKKQQIVKTRIDKVLSKVHEILKNLEKEIPANEQLEINKRMDKLLRIKNSTNLEYILATAEDLLKYTQKQEQKLLKKGLEDKRLELAIQTRSLLREINKDPGRPDTLSEDIVEKIDEITTKSRGISFFNKLLEKIKNFLTQTPEVKVIKGQIKIYNRQLWEFTKLYFKEPTPEYKQKVVASIKGVWRARKKAKHTLQQVKRLSKLRKKNKETKAEFGPHFIQELASFSGWLLAFYVIYYFASLYLNTKNFGLTNIPEGFKIYDSSIFKYLLSIIFLLHATAAIKVNFLPKSRIASIMLVGIFGFGSLIAIFNF